MKTATLNGQICFQAFNSNSNPHTDCLTGAGVAALINGFTQCHACVVQTTTRYAGVHKKLYKKITNRITIRMFKSIVKKKGDFNGK